MLTKILIIEDNVNSAELLKDYVESWGYIAIVANQGLEGLELARKNSPDIVLLDIMLPGMSGFEICRELRKKKINEQSAIIMLSALTSSEDRITAYEAGADNFISKPINFEELRAIINRNIDKITFLQDMEPKDLILQKMTMFLQKKVKSADTGAICFGQGILTKILKNTGEKDENIEVGKLVYEYLDYLKKTSDESCLKNFLWMFKGYTCTQKIIPVLEYCCKQDNKNKKIKNELDAFKLQKTAEICADMNKFTEYADKENGGNFEKAYARLKKEPDFLGLSKDFLNGIEQEIENLKIRNTII